MKPIVIPPHVAHTLEDRARRFTYRGFDAETRKPGAAPVLEQEATALTRLLEETYAEGYMTGRRQGDDE